MSDALAREMATLADRLAAEDPGLDFTLASLDVLDALVASHPTGERPSAKACGAYLGETMRRAYPDAIRWVEHEGAPALAIGAMRWFPLAKVEKRRLHGATDSLRPFAAVALAPLSPVDDGAERAERAKRDAEVGEMAAALIAAPSPETLERFDTTFTTFTHWSRHGEVLGRLGIRVELLAPFLPVPPRGRGWRRIDAGAIAAAQLAQLVLTGVAPRAETLALLHDHLSGRERIARGNAAHALAYVDLREGSSALAAALAVGRDRAIVAGTWRALATFGSDVEFGHAGALPIEPLIPAVLAALQVRSPDVNTALDTLRAWSAPWEHRGVLAPFAAALISLLDGRPAIAKYARHLLTSYLWGIVHGHTPPDPRVNALDGRLGMEGSMALARLRPLPIVDRTPVDDEFLLEDATDCSAQLGAFLREHGVATLRRADGALVRLRAALEVVERLGEKLIAFADVSGTPVYFLRDDHNDAAELRVVTVEDGALRDRGTFDTWLRATLD